MMDDRSVKLLKEKSKKYFDRVVSENFIIDEPEKCYQDLLDLLQKNNRTEGILLDIGCGTGNMLEILADAMPALSLYGVDISPKSIAAAKQKVPCAILTEGDGENLRFSDNFADIVICMHCFHHFPRPDQALSEMYRITKRNGNVIIVENSFPLHKRLYKSLRYFLSGHKCGDVRQYSKKQLVDMMEKSGLRVVSRALVGKHSIMLSGAKK